MKIKFNEKEVEFTPKNITEIETLIESVENINFGIEKYTDFKNLLSVELDENDKFVNMGLEDVLPDGLNKIFGWKLMKIDRQLEQYLSIFYTKLEEKEIRDLSKIKINDKEKLLKWFIPVIIRMFNDEFLEGEYPERDVLIKNFNLKLISIIGLFYNTLFPKRKFTFVCKLKYEEYILEVKKERNSNEIKTSIYDNQYENLYRLPIEEILNTSLNLVEYDEIVEIYLDDKLIWSK